MLSKFEINRAKQLSESLRKAVSFFVYNPNIEKDKEELNALQEKCEHSFLDGECVYCGKEVNK